MTTLGFRYRIRQNTGVPRPIRANDLEQAVAGWLSALAWSDWTVTSPSKDMNGTASVPFMSIARLQPAGMPDGDFRELNIMASDGKPFYRELIDDEHGTNIYDEAIDRLWQTVQLLEAATVTARSRTVLIDIVDGAIAFDGGTRKPFPSLCLDRIPRLPDSLSSFRRHRRPVQPADLMLFETSSFTVDEDWFTMMLHGAASLEETWRRACRPPQDGRR